MGNLRVVPVSTIPAVVLEMIVLVPYVALLTFIPQKRLDGKVDVMGTNVIGPVNCGRQQQRGQNRKYSP